MPNSKPFLQATDVKKVLAAAESHAKQNGWAVHIVVTDDGGYTLGALRLDGAAPMASLIAAEKARIAALSRRETLFYESMINQGRAAFLSAPLDGFIEGGVPIIIDRQCVGAVGVSGVKSDQDAETAKAGVAALS